MPQQKPPEQKQFLRAAAQLSGLAIQMGFIIYLGNLLGAWVEKEYALSKAEELITFAAIGMAIYMMIRQAINANK